MRELEDIKKEFLYTGKKTYRQTLIWDICDDMSGSTISYEEEIKQKNELRNKKLDSL